LAWCWLRWVFRAAQTLLELLAPLIVLMLCSFLVGRNGVPPADKVG
jgi:predicted permease